MFAPEVGMLARRCINLGLNVRPTVYASVFSQCFSRNNAGNLSISSSFKLSNTCSLRSGFKTNYSYNCCVKKHNIAALFNTESEETVSKGKVFVELEAAHHHKVLENSDLHLSTIYKTDPCFCEKYQVSELEYKDILNVTDWKSKSPYNVATSFVSLGVYFSEHNINVTMDDCKFDELTSALEKKIPSLNDDQIMDCLVAIQLWPKSEHVKASNYLKVWKALDDTCYERFTNWSIDKILYFMDLWYQIKLARLSNFVFKGLNRVSRKCEDLTQSQMIQALFYMSCTRKLHPAISLREYEFYIQKHITHLSVEELGIFALAFFKTKTSIINIKILMYMMQRVIEEVESIPQITLTAIVKAIRFSHKPEIGFTANDFVNKLAEKKIDSVTLVNAIHILHISTQVQFYNQEAITKLAEKFCSDPSVARLKDIERVAFILSLFNHIPPSTPNILEIITEELNKPQHVEAGKQFPLTLLSLLCYLSLLKTYPETQIQQALDEGYLKSKYENRFMIPAQALQIDYNRVLEGPPKCQHLLSPPLREYLARRYSLYIPEKNKPLKSQFDHMFVEVLELTKELLGGEEYTLASYTLPHFPRPDILFRLDEAGKPLVVPEEMRTKAPWVDVVRAPHPSGWFAVLLGGRNMYMHNVPRLVGEQVAKLRQLRLLGYTPVTIPFHYWKGEKNKLEYLKLKYFTRTE